MGQAERTDRSRVTLDTEADCRYWEARFGTTRVAIAAAVAAVGDAPGRVNGWLLTNRRRGAG